MYGCSVLQMSRTYSSEHIVARLDIRSIVAVFCRVLRADVSPPWVDSPKT